MWVESVTSCVSLPLDKDFQYLGKAVLYEMENMLNLTYYVIEHQSDCFHISSYMLYLICQQSRGINSMMSRGVMTCSPHVGGKRALKAKQIYSS